MKKLVTTILAVIYLGFSAGATMHLHFCMGEFVNISFSNTTESACGKCGMEKHSNNNDCCKDVKVSVKITDKHVYAHQEHHIEKQFVVIHTGNFLSAFDFTKEPDVYIPVSPFSYPPGDSNPAYIQHRNLRI